MFLSDEWLYWVLTSCAIAVSLALYL